eukprot:TRINITY_DN11045_c0_g1_i1.p1 TRINITY_DN11045_c0_g1~~TRINITY_DN11045_c0_g1_i1.p1  ORF type:complete len:408 (-),score=91.68 TRINITY_DN11045_c0_g1_i1:124-1185(-)
MNEETIKATARALVSTGLSKLGYNYVNLDDCWSGGRFPNGTQYSDPKSFPSGIKNLADYVHSLGLKFGLYTDRGNKTCAGRPGALGFEEIDARTYAEWGVDYLKEDSCYATQDHQQAFQEYGRMRDALNSTGRPIFFSLCGWYSWYSPVGSNLGNSFRIGPDDTNWPGVISNVNIDVMLGQHAGPGGWNDPCLLLESNYLGQLAVTPTQSRTQLNMWAILAAPMLLSLNIRNLSKEALLTYSNKEVIAINQDSLGRQGFRVSGGDLNPSHSKSINILARHLEHGRVALLMVNAGTQTQKITCDRQCFQSFGFADAKVKVRDLWRHEDLSPVMNTMSATVAADGDSVMYLLTKA